MFVKREKYFVKRWKSASYMDFRDKSQRCKRTSYWLFGIIPVFIKTEVIGGDYQ